VFEPIAQLVHRTFKDVIWRGFWSDWRMFQSFVCTAVCTNSENDSVAQPVEHLTFNQRVVGSNPARVTKLTAIPQESSRISH
jgi:hypothetical protein